MQKLDLEQAKETELYSYQIALNTVIINCQEQLARVKEKLAKVQKESEESK